MIGKKAKEEPKEKDFHSLDKAVLELSKQTEELLGKSGEKATHHAKPTLPKKAEAKPKAKSRGHHFDIISTGKTTKTPATLKTVVPSKVEVEKKEAEPAALPNTVSGSIITTHAAGALKVDAVPEEKEEKKDEPKKTEQPKVELKAPEPAPEKHADPKLEIEKNDSFDPTPEDDGEIDLKADEHLDITEPPAEGSNELYANNLTKDVAPKGFSAETPTKKPTVFDTNEYHPPLHDWSKLEHRHRGTWVVLLVLLLAAGAAAYFLYQSGSLSI